MDALKEKAAKARSEWIGALARMDRRTVLVEVRQMLLDAADLVKQSDDESPTLDALACIPEYPAGHVDPDVEALIRWRDGLALDWSGDDLYFHVTHCLQTDPMERYPVEHREALARFRTLGEDEQFRIVCGVLD